MLSNAPAKAAKGTQEISPRTPAPRMRLGRKIRPKIPPKEAPAEMPRTCGQASGLRSSACSTTPQAAMPPPMAMPKSTRGRRARKRISTLGSLENKFLSARERSSGTGPSNEQPMIDRIMPRKRMPLTSIILLRSRTFTSTLPVAVAVCGAEALRMNQPGQLRQRLAETRSWPQDFVGPVGVNAPLSHRGNGLEICPAFNGRVPLRSHAGLDDDFRRSGHHVLVGQVQPRLTGVAGNVCAAGQSDQLVDKILSAHRNQRANADQQKHPASGSQLHTLFHFRDLSGDFHDQLFPRGFISQ